MSKHTQCIVANTGALNMQKELVEPSSDRVCRVLFPDVLGEFHLKKKEEKKETAFINSYDQLHGSIKLSNMVLKCRWTLEACFGVSGSILEFRMHAFMVGQEFRKQTSRARL